jgi:hypothetical protein
MIEREASGHAVCQNRIYKMINLLWNSSGEFLLSVTLKKIQTRWGISKVLNTVVLFQNQTFIDKNMLTDL